MRRLLLVGFLILGGCVRTLEHTPVAPTRTNAETVLTTMAQSRYLASRFSGPDVTPSEIWPVSGCLASGEEFQLMRVEITEDGICGDAGYRQRRCIAYTDMAALGMPRDRVVFGYLPVANFLHCEAPA